MYEQTLEWDTLGQQGPFWIHIRIMEAYVQEARQQGPEGG